MQWSYLYVLALVWVPPSTLKDETQTQSQVYIRLFKGPHNIFERDI